MTSIISIHSLILDLPPSCIEFCPAARDYFVVGTYFLDRKDEEDATTTTSNDNDNEEDDNDGNEVQETKKPQVRTGSLILFRVDGDEVTQIRTLPTPYAILDLHFSPQDPTLLAVASSTGSLQLFRLDLTSTTSTSTPSLIPQSLHQLFDPLTLILSLCWHPTNTNTVGITLSNGEVHLVSLPPSTSTPPPSTTSTTPKQKEILKHDLEAWTLSFSSKGQDIFSGGDDAALRYAANIPTLTNVVTTTTTTTTTSNTGEEEEDGEEQGEPKFTWTDQRLHNAGVTAILPLENEENVTITGSYDDNIRVLRTPKMGRRTILAEENLEGGVWRLKMLKQDKNGGRYTVLASCMHAGTRVVQINKDDQGEWTITVLAMFEEHKSMNYGSDVQPQCGNEQTIISTSFYDKLLCLWRFQLP